MTRRLVEILKDTSGMLARRSPQLLWFFLAFYAFAEFKPTIKELLEAGHLSKFDAGFFSVVRNYKIFFSC